LAKAPGLTVRGVVGHVEYAGAELMATLTLPSQGEACIVCLPAGTAAHAGAEFEVTVPWEALHVFDAGGQRMSIGRCDTLKRVA
jgi:multiple sugar transport system ATP-binding protein